MSAPRNASLGDRIFMVTQPAAPEQQLMPGIRDAVRERIERTSLRDVARRVGMTPSGLAKFASGSEPYRKTVRKLVAWYVREQARTPQHADSPSAETVAAAIRILALLTPTSGRSKLVAGSLGNVKEVLPRSESWRAEFRGYDSYMRAGDAEQHADD